MGAAHGTRIRKRCQVWIVHGAISCAELRALERQGGEVRIHESTFAQFQAAHPGVRALGAIGNGMVLSRTRTRATCTAVQKDVGLDEIVGEHSFSELLGDPRYQAFLRRINLPEMAARSPGDANRSAK